MSTLAKLNVAALRKECETRGLSSEGKKAELVERLKSVWTPTDDDKATEAEAAPKRSTRVRKRKVASSSEDDSFDEEDEPPKSKKRKSSASVDASDGDSQPKLKRSNSKSKSVDYGEVFTSPAPYGRVEGLKIVSWNVNGLRSLLKPPFLFADYLRREDADIVCVQETKLQEKDVAGLDEEATAAELYPYRYHSCSTASLGYSGTCVYSKVEPIAVTYGLGIAKHDKEGRCVTLEFPDFYLVTTYTPNAGQKLERLKYRTQEWDVDFMEYLKRLDEKKPVIWTGDLNVAHQEIDIADPKGNKKSAGFTPEERQQFGDILDKVNLVDSFRKLNPDAINKYTYWGLRFKSKLTNKGWRLDYFVVSERFMERVEDSLIRGKEEGSDHCPICLVLKA